MWPKVAAKIQRRDRTLEALLRSSEPCALEGDSLTVAFAYPFHYACLGGPEEEKMLEEAVEGVLNHPLKIVRVIRAPGEVVEAPASVPATGQQMGELPVDEDPLYLAAKELGGRVSVIEDGGDTNG